jgi:hypothetical protein
MLDCQECGEPYAIRVGQMTSFICPRCQDRAQMSAALAQSSHRQRVSFGFFRLLILVCNLMGLALIGSGAYLALRDIPSFTNGVCCVALGILSLFLAQGGDVLLVIERRTRVSQDPDSGRPPERRRSRHQSHQRRRHEEESFSPPNSER